MEPDQTPKEPGLNPLTGNKVRLANLRPNRNGRTPGTKNKIKNALTRTKKDPVLELIVIAQLLRTNPPEMQRKALESEMKIWMELLEYDKAKKRPASEKEQKQEQSKKAAEATFDLLKELETEHNGPYTGTERTSHTPSVDTRPINLQAEAGSEEDLLDSQGQ